MYLNYLSELDQSDLVLFLSPRLCCSIGVLKEHFAILLTPHVATVQAGGSVWSAGAGMAEDAGFVGTSVEADWAMLVGF